MIVGLIIVVILASALKGASEATVITGGVVFVCFMLALAVIVAVCEKEGK